MINKFIDYRTHVEKKQTNRAPKRILFFRDGVSEGEFTRVLEQELPLIKGLSDAFCGRVSFAHIGSTRGLQSD